MDFQQMEQPYGGMMQGGGLPSLSYPMAQQVQSQGRGEDTMLVHMTPNEVNSLQGLAMAHGGSLTINPITGLPEAGFLGNILKKLAPTLIGAALAATGVGAPLAAGLVAAGLPGTCLALCARVPDPAWCLARVASACAAGAD